MRTREKKAVGPLGKLIDAGLADKKIRASDLASQTGISVQTIYSILYGTKDTNPEFLQKIIDALDLDEGAAYVAARLVPVRVTKWILSDPKVLRRLVLKAAASGV